MPARPTRSTATTRSTSARLSLVALPEVTAALAKVEAYCERHVPEQYRDEMRLDASARGKAITIVERRPPWREDYGPEWTSMRIAQMRYDPATSCWSIFWADRNDRWLRYPARPARSIERILAVIESDQSGAFFG